jgi:hypothetical protein
MKGFKFYKFFNTFFYVLKNEENEFALGLARTIRAHKRLIYFTFSLYLDINLLWY